MVTSAQRAPVLMLREFALEQITCWQMAGWKGKVLVLASDGFEPVIGLEFRLGKSALFDYFVGQVMAATNGRADPIVVIRMLEERLRG